MIYVGVHSIKNPDIFDGYFGSGLHIVRAVKKYGKENFIREILSVFDSSEEAFTEERRIVDKIFVKRDDTYNLKVGGDGFAGGEDHPMFGTHWTEEQKKNQSERVRGENHPFYGEHHTEETKQLIREKQKGENNNNYGKPLLEETKKKISESKGMTLKVIKQRREDIKNIEKVRGYKTRLAEKWERVSSSHAVNYFIKNYAPDLV